MAVGEEGICLPEDLYRDEGFMPTGKCFLLAPKQADVDRILEGIYSSKSVGNLN